jgi:hypothetical protein
MAFTNQTPSRIHEYHRPHLVVVHAWVAFVEWNRRGEVGEVLRVSHNPVTSPFPITSPGTISGDHDSIPTPPGWYRRYRHS